MIYITGDLFLHRDKEIAMEIMSGSKPDISSSRKTWAAMITSL